MKSSPKGLLAGGFEELTLNMRSPWDTSSFLEENRAESEEFAEETGGVEGTLFEELVEGFGGPEFVAALAKGAFLRSTIAFTLGLSTLNWKSKASEFSARFLTDCTGPC